MAKMKKDSLYIIKWSDHFSSSGWFGKVGDYKKKKFNIKTVGFFIGEDKNHIHLAQSNGKYQYGDIMSIIKTCIVEIKEVE